MSCSHCKGKGISQRWRNTWTDYVCTSCGGLGETGSLVGRFDGLHEYPDATAPNGGQRLALVYVKDGKRADLPGQVYWRLVMVLERPGFTRGNAHGGTRRAAKNAKGSAINLPVIKSSAIITGFLAEPDEMPADLPERFEGCIQEACGFPRSSYRGEWTVSRQSRAPHRVKLRSLGYVLDKVH